MSYRENKIIRSGELIIPGEKEKDPLPFLSCLLPFPLQTMSISPGTRRTVSVFQVAVPSTEASAFPGGEVKAKVRTAAIISMNQGMGQ